MYSSLPSKGWVMRLGSLKLGPVDSVVTVVDNHHTTHDYLVCINLLIQDHVTVHGIPICQESDDEL